MKKVNVLHVITLGLIVTSNICFGSEENPLKKIRIESAALAVSQGSKESPTYMKQKLEFFYKKELDSDKYEISARLLRGKIPIYEFENASECFPEIKDLCELKHTDHSYSFYKKRQLKIEVQSDSKGSKDVLLVDEVEHTGQTKELLDMLSCYPVMHADTVVFQKAEWDDEKIATIYDPKNVALVKALLLSDRKPIIVKFIEGNDSHLVKVMECTNGDYVHWNAWKPRWVHWCVGMPGSCAYGMDSKEVTDPHKIEIDLNKDKEYLPTYQRNKWRFRGLIAGILSCGGYWLSEYIKLFISTLHSPEC